MSALLLIVTIARQRVAIPTASVECVVEIDRIEPVPLVAAHVAGLFALRSRVLTVIDATACVEGMARPGPRPNEAVIVNGHGHGYALLVEHIEDVVQPENDVEPSRAVLAPCWSSVALGTIEIDGGFLLVVDPLALVLGNDQRAAA